MKKQVRDTAAGKSLSAYVVLNKRRQHVATVNAHFSNANVCTVDVWNHGDDTAARCLGTALQTGAVTQRALQDAILSAPDYCLDHARRENWAACHFFSLQQSRGGDLYDALAGLIVDGHTLNYHRQTPPELRKKTTALLEAYKRAHRKGAPTRATFEEKAERMGAHFANWITGNGYTDIYHHAGFERLRGLGYDVIQAL